MGILGILFSFSGRIRRTHYWLGLIGVGFFTSIVANFTFMPAYVAMVMAAMNGQTPDPSSFGPAAMAGLAIWFASLWPGLALNVKRCHDRDKSGWFLLVYWLVSLTIIGALWPLIELGFLDGTPGPNKYGPSPKGIGGDSLPVT